MGLERGFRRIVIVLSVALLALGLVLDAWLMLPDATVQVFLKDGREFTVGRNVLKEYMTDRDSVAYALKRGDGVYKGGYKGLPALSVDIAKDLSLIPPPPDYRELIDASTIESVKVIRGPSYWWWTDSNVTKIAVGLVVFLWIVFYTARWIARGFVRP